MLFNSINFAVLFLIVTSLYFFLSERNQKLLLLAASIIFYCYSIPKYIVILFIVIVIDYFSGIYIKKARTSFRKPLLLLSIASNLGILFFFKYFNFFNQNLNTLIEIVGWNYSIPLLEIILPIGLSFHVFQSLGYVIDVYKGKIEPERNFLVYALYVLYFPQLVAGPIERAANMLPQMKGRKVYAYERIRSGLQLMATGFLKKCVVADNLAIIADQVYSNPHAYGGFYLFTATFFFSFQIFCDFSGYTDIARGTSRILGMELMVNFDKPYFAASITEFWRRWHISLTTWFKDYLYIPLGGNRVGFLRKNINIFIVFIVSGLWHGASWTFLIWGFIHGVFITLQNGLIIVNSRYIKKEFPYSVKVTCTFLVVFVSWIFFRANTFRDAIYILNGMITNMQTFFKGSELIISNFLVEGYLLILLIIIFQYVDLKKNIWERVNECSLIPRWSIYYATILIFLTLGQFTRSLFIYFQF
jgi:alginate O-acetyltransferase complex protein AlgI